MENRIQKDYDDLKKKSELTEKFILFADKIKIDDKDVPKTEKGLESKAKEIIERINKKLEKETNDEIDIFQTKVKKISIKEKKKRKKY